MGDAMWQGQRNFQLNAQTVLRDLYRLLTMVLADGNLTENFNGADDPLQRLRDQYLEDEFVHLLVGTAITNRIQEEHMREFREDIGELAFAPLVHECGTLRANVENAEETTLTLREACNKIVHAVHMIAETAGDPGNHPLSEFVILRGQLGDAAWLARLNVIEYVRASVMNFNDLR